MSIEINGYKAIIDLDYEDSMKLKKYGAFWDSVNKKRVLTPARWYKFRGYAQKVLDLLDYEEDAAVWEEWLNLPENSLESGFTARKIRGSNNISLKFDFNREINDPIREAGGKWNKPNYRWEVPLENINLLIDAMAAAGFEKIAQYLGKYATRAVKAAKPKIGPKIRQEAKKQLKQLNRLAERLVEAKSNPEKLLELASDVSATKRSMFEPVKPVKLPPVSMSAAVQAAIDREIEAAKPQLVLGTYIHCKNPPKVYMSDEAIKDSLPHINRIRRRRRQRELSFKFMKRISVRTPNIPGTDLCDLSVLQEPIPAEEEVRTEKLMKTNEVIDFILYREKPSESIETECRFTDVTLRNYQDWAKESILDCVQDTKRAMLILPTGGGKSYIIGGVMIDMYDGERKFLITTVNQTLVHQLYRSLLAQGFREDEINRVTGSFVDFDPKRRITIISSGIKFNLVKARIESAKTKETEQKSELDKILSLMDIGGFLQDPGQSTSESGDKEDIKDLSLREQIINWIFDEDNPIISIFDEVHCGAPRTRYLGELPIPAKWRIACSATFERPDGYEELLYYVFGRNIISLENWEGYDPELDDGPNGPCPEKCLQRLGHLPKPEVKFIKKLEDVEDILRDPNQKTLLLYHQIKKGITPASQWLTEQGIDHEIIIGPVPVFKLRKRRVKNPRLSREEIKDGFNNGGCNIVLATVGCFGLGEDLPAADVLVVQASGSRTQIKQNFGRILRGSQAKRIFIIPAASQKTQNKCKINVNSLDYIDRI